jgi:hypothetical protein
VAPSWEYSESDHNGNTNPAGASDSGVQRYNSLHDNAEGGIFLQTSDSQFYGNICCNNGQMDIEFWAGSSHVSNNKVYENTFCGGTSYAVYFIALGNVSGNSIINNIIWADFIGTSAPCSNYMTEISNIKTGVITDYTLSSSDFHLKPGSAAVDGGVIIGGLSTTTPGNLAIITARSPISGRMKAGGRRVVGPTVALSSTAFRSLPIS